MEQFKEFAESLSDVQLEQVLEIFNCESTGDAMSALFKLNEVLEEVAESRGIDTEVTP